MYGNARPKGTDKGLHLAVHQNLEKCEGLSTSSACTFASILQAQRRRSIRFFYASQESSPYRFETIPMSGRVLVSLLFFMSGLPTDMG